MTNENRIEPRLPEITPIPDRLLGTWVFNDGTFSTSGLQSGSNVFSINFESDNNQYDVLEATYKRGHVEEIFYKNTKTSKNDYVGSYASDEMENDVIIFNKEAYKTIKITDVSNLTNSDEFLTWLSSNATKQEGRGV